MTPDELARELGISGKHLRAWLREQYPRTEEMKNKPWNLTAAHESAARRRFATRHLRAETREGMVVTTVALPEAMYLRLGSISRKSRTAIAELIRVAVRLWLGSHKGGS